ncbi:MAG: dihydroorotate dehydrogenase [Elusimicrobia bacterium]|nr:dihydroorotate dehydrogenase [Elusimicrobiota bacterium]
MSVEFAGLKLDNPYIASSGCWGYGWEGHDYFPDLEWGAVISKTITVEKREGNDPPRIFESEAGIINRIGLQNCGLDHFIRAEHPKNSLLPYPVIVSIFGNTTEEWEHLVKILTAEGAPAFELNLSCPNLKKKILADDITSCGKLVKILKKKTDRPIIPKINALNDPVRLAEKLKSAGADAIVCSNTFPALFSLCGEFFEGGLSGPAIKPVVLKAIRNIKAAVEIDIAGCGGIESGEDVDDYRNAGASVFQIGSALFARPGILKEIMGKL